MRSNEKEVTSYPSDLREVREPIRRLTPIRLLRQRSRMASCRPLYNEPSEVCQHAPAVRAAHRAETGKGPTTTRRFKVTARGKTLKQWKQVKPLAEDGILLALTGSAIYGAAMQSLDVHCFR